MKYIWIMLLAAVSCTSVQTIPMVPGDRNRLDEGWKLSREGTSQQYNAAVPSTVAGTLHANGYFGEGLLEGRKYAEMDRTPFDDVWTYTREFGVNPADEMHYELVFDGLNYYADIRLNGVQLASPDTTAGVFIRRAYDVTDLLKSRNKLSVSLRRAQKGDLNIGFVDWNPRPLDESMGIVRPVTLHASGMVSVEDVFVIPSLDTETLSQADLTVKIRLKNRSKAPVDATLILDLEGESTLPVTLASGESTLELTPAQIARLHLDNPRIWWTHDLGSPEMYSLDVAVEVAGVLSDCMKVDFGVRDITSRLTPEGYRQFTLNGRDVLIKGAGWSDDIFLEDTPEQIERQVAYVKDMNMNLIRFENIWGKDDAAYDACDRMGLMALVGWSCQWEWEDYCGLPETEGYGCINTPETEDLAVRYFHDQVVRLHNHPAVIGWLTGSDRIPNPGLEKRYLEIYEQEDYRPYVNSAKNLLSTVSGWSGTKMAGPYDYVAPDYWYVDTENGGAFGFNTETGIGPNLPQEESLRRMIPADELWPLSPAWDYHCTASSSCMNTMQTLVKAVNGHYGEADSFEDFVRKAYAVDYDGTRAMFESFRVRIPKATGIVQWMLNSAWPSIYWQQFDYYGVPTAGYYGTKKGCEPLQLLFDYATRKVYAVNETANPRELTAVLKVYDAASKLLHQESRPVTALCRESVPVFNLAAWDGQPHFVALELLDKEASVATNFYCLPAQDSDYDWKSSTWYDTPILRYADLRFVFEGEKADVKLTVEPADNLYVVTLKNESPVIAYMNVLKALNPDGNLAVPAFWSDNFFPLLPGETRTVTCKADRADLTIKLAQ